MTEGYVVPKRPVPITLKLAFLEAKELSLYLAEHAARHTGPERPSDVLNGGDRFVPALDADGRLLLFQRTEVMAVSFDASYEERSPDEADEEEGGTRVAVELTLQDGTRVAGSVAYWRPPGRRRLQDFLNSAEQFIPVHEGETMHLVNRDKIVSVSTP
ncbi:MAG: hypothetical protein GWN99_16590 [Gemmatimonadetes bacterium]|uniref:Uncharacterized protein n=1 Tax=Candidatus Kutchimonas denitrificans TaxID=3056748 RepID=A0AAE4Z8F9_9BACT|nr:hypothetical protein [Gemmatimonadota bacterium]NIR74407.1 hypothetical protein [Candidatus Kutchimonas denitrificans]NIS02658.1 hypothetical protein [Gemmatimonadota bacterium]NIT68533.1 hypothetical protein [Gemmatimonadota bacterium]NIU52010.1 hypothetical protein [Gemmatimonadota bacterium]